MHLLIFGDDPASRVLRQAMAASGHDAVLHERAQLQRFPRSGFDRCDLLILSAARPAHGVSDTLRQLRRDGVVSPVLLLANGDDVEPICAALDAGAGDYMLLPVSPEELLTRLRVLIRRTLTAPAATLVFQGLEMDRIGHVVRRDAFRLDLTTTEFRLLEQFLLHPGVVVSRSSLLKSVWGGELGPESNVVDVHIANLRRKLRADGAVPLIRTIRGVGYCLDDKERVERGRQRTRGEAHLSCAS